MAKKQVVPKKSRADKKIERAVRIATETKRGERRANREENKRWQK